MSAPHYCQAENAPKFLDWIRNRGGLAVWRSVDMSDPGASWSTPARTTEGDPTPKPHPWKAEAAPSRVITDLKDVLVVEDKEVERFHVSIHAGSGGLIIKCSDASIRRIRESEAATGKGAYHEFDYGTQEAVIKAPVTQMTLAEWAERNER